MSQSTNLALPYLGASQSQKHVTVNEGLRFLDVLVQIAVKSAALSTPPGSAADGQRWIIGPAPTGLWAGHATQIAESPRKPMKSRLNWPGQSMAAMLEKNIGTRFQPWLRPTTSV
jgi:hypothetical protein